MLELRETAEFSAWLKDLRDGTARARILVRVERVARGNPGDVEPVGEGVSEMRLHFGPGYRVYYTERAGVVIVLLAGGDKSSQQKDIATAVALAKGL